jgi:hypothetical protein
MERLHRSGMGLCNNTFYHSPLFVLGHWVEQTPKTEGMCSYGDCTKQATWTRKMGWIVAPGSPPGDVCDTHHCWEPVLPESVYPSTPGAANVALDDRVSTHYYGDHCYPPHSEMP